MTTPDRPTLRQVIDSGQDPLDILATYCDKDHGNGLLTSAYEGWCAPVGRATIIITCPPTTPRRNGRNTARDTIFATSDNEGGGKNRVVWNRISTSSNPVSSSILPTDQYVSGVMWPEPS